MTEGVKTDISPPPRVTHRHASPPAVAKRGHRVWRWLIPLIIVLGVGGYFLYTRMTTQPADAKGGKGDAGGRGIPVTAVTARRGDTKIYLNGLGSVTPLNTVTIRTRVDGQIMEIGFVEGQTVQENKLLFELDPRPFQVQLEQAEGQMAKDQALLKNAQADLARYQEAKEAVARQLVDTAASNVAQYEGAVKIDQGAIDNAKLQLQYCKITAPLTGRIGLKTVDKGNIVHTSDANGLAVITQLQPISVVFNLPEDDIPRVMRKLHAGDGKTTNNLEVDAYDRDRKNKLAIGTLLAVDSQIDMTSATVRLKAIFPNDDFSLFPNQFVNARLLIDTLKEVVTVSTAAVQRSPTANFVYVIKPDSTVEMRTVAIGPTEGDDTVIESGLSAGEQAVIEGVDKLQDGTKITREGGGKSATRPTSRPRSAGAATRESGIRSGGNRGAGSRPRGEQ